MESLIIEWPSSKMVGVIFLVGSIIFLSCYIYFYEQEDYRYLEAFFFLFISSLFYLKRKGFEMEKSKNRARMYYQILFWRIGTWKLIDKYDKILFRTYSYITRDTDGDGVDERYKGKDYQVYLVGKKTKNWKIYTSSDYKYSSEVKEILNKYTDFEIVYLNH